VVVVAVADLGWNLVDVRDVADAHVLALETRKAACMRFLCVQVGDPR
jgi:nucleoside-diphosphate-sugar epimerase